MLILCCTWTKIITNTTEQIQFKKTKHMSTDMSLQSSRCDSFTNCHEIALDLKKQR